MTGVTSMSTSYVAVRLYCHHKCLTSYCLKAKVQFTDAPLAGSRAQAILKPLLLRRTKNSTLEGKPLLELLPKYIDIVTLKFTPEEREVCNIDFVTCVKSLLMRATAFQVYESFEKRTKIRINKFIKENSLVKKYVL